MTATKRAIKAYDEAGGRQQPRELDGRAPFHD
jgi:hypothetical protein